MSPNMVVNADNGYDARTTFLISVGGLDYRFKIKVNNLYSDLPRDYRFQIDALEQVVLETSKGLNISFASTFDSFIVDFILDATAGVINNIYALFRNALISDNDFLVDLGILDNVHYAWTHEFTGSDPNYPGHETYGTAYGFRFTGACFETVDLVLDSNGNLYGSNPIGNFTLNQNTEDIINNNIGNQKDITGEWAIPNIISSEQDGIPPAYFVGNDLHFFGMTYGSQNPLEYIITNAADTSFSLYRTSSNQGFLSLIPLDGTWNSSTIVYPSGIIYQFSQGNIRNYINWRSYLSSSTSGSYRTYDHQFFNNTVRMNFNLPNFYYLQNQVTDITQNNSLGYIDNVSIQGFADCYLNTVSFTPAPDFPDVPTGDPIPIGDIPSDPTDYDPDPDSDPDPVPGVTYPGDDPDPDPEPVPPIPPIVSGNDDLWPDMNEIFNTEAEMDSFLTPLSNFEFTSLANLTDEFSASIVWVSTIMMSLYNGSEYSVLFSILAIFFIACALLGIYKWWSS